VLLAAGAVALSAIAPADPSLGRIVLGSKLGGPKYVCHVDLAECGWGTPAPRNLSLGGDPSGTIIHIRWDGWGKPVATGHGLHAISGPGGGYYPKLGRIELRVYDIGRCTHSRRLAYRRMIVRYPARPGGPLGGWTGFSVTGTTSTCSGRLAHSRR
jgi:hypothetical protein